MAGAGPHVLPDAGVGGGVGSGWKRGRWLLSSGGNGVGQRYGESGWCVVGTNGLLNNVWVCRVRGDSRHCGDMSTPQQLYCLFLFHSSCSVCLCRVHVEQWCPNWELLLFVFLYSIFAFPLVKYCVFFTAQTQKYFCENRRQTRQNCSNTCKLWVGVERRDGSTGIQY